MKITAPENRDDKRLQIQDKIPKSRSLREGA